MNRIRLSRRAACRTPRRPSDQVFRLCVRSVACCAAFPLVGPLPSTDSAATVGPALFACFFGTTSPSDSPATCMVGVRSWTFPNRSPCRPAGGRCERGNLQGLPVPVL